MTLVQHDLHHKNTSLKKKSKEILCSVYCKHNKEFKKKRKNTGYLRVQWKFIFQQHGYHRPPIRSSLWHTGIQSLSSYWNSHQKQQSDWNCTPTEKTRVHAPRCSLPIIQCDATDYGLRWVWLVMGLKFYPTNPLSSKHILTTLACVHILG